MRIAIISDVHGNLTALDAVLSDLRRQKPDVIFHGGDIPYGGCNPAEGIDCIRQEGWPGVLGNTDEMLWNAEPRAMLEASAPKLKPLFRVLFDECGPATCKMIGEERMVWLKQLPTELRHEGLGGKNSSQTNQGQPEQSLVLLHAAPGNLWRAPMDSADDAELESTYKSLNAAIIVYCHIHRPFVRQVENMTVCNCGSVGSPYDGDPRGSYLLIDDGKPAIRRLEYDVEKEAARLL